MRENPLQQLQLFGQSPWLDNIRRGDISSGWLEQLKNNGIVGVTANPTIFEKAITGSTDYDAAIETLVHQGKSAGDIYKILIVEDIVNAADIFRPVYDRTNGLDGYISIEVAPSLAHDAAGTIQEALDFKELIRRPNVFVKVPATAECIPAIEELLYQGVSINVTLIFSLDVYKAVIEAYISAIERRVNEGLQVERIASVASFFVSRVDARADEALKKLIQAETNPERIKLATSLLGTTAINNSKLAYQAFLEAVATERFRELERAGARKQRPLWASTSTKDPAYRDVMYVEQLIGPDTVNTMPPQTVEAFQDHGKVARTVDTDMAKARMQLEQLAGLGISLRQITDELTVEGVASFTRSFDSLADSIREKREQLLKI